MNNNIGYIYKTTNLINGKIYIGQHKNSEPNLNYFGSGKILFKALKKYGKNNFIVEVLLWCETIEQLNKAEIDFIKAYDSTNKNIGYNISLGGFSFMKGLRHSKESIEKIANAMIGNKYGLGSHRSEEHIMKLRLANKGNKYNLGNHHSVESKKKIIQSLIGNKRGVGKHMSEENKRKMSELHKGHKYNLGKKRSDEVKRKMSEARKGRKMPEKTRIALLNANTGRRQTDEAKRKIGEKSRGRFVSEETRKKVSEASKRMHQKRKALLLVKDLNK